MSAKHNLDLVHGMYEALNSQDLDAHDKYWTQNMIWHAPAERGDYHGITAFKNEVMKPFYAIFPDYHVKNDIEVADENWVSATGFLTATHRHTWMGIEATGKPISMRFSDFWLVRDGLLSENWVMIDYISVLRQLGIQVFPAGQ
jgi:predicted ester cyclase